MSEDVEEKVEEVSTDVIISDDNVTFTSTGEVMSVAELASSLAEMDEGMEVTSEYFEFPMGEAVRCMYVGDLMISGRNNRKVPAVKLLMSNEKIVINASSVVVSTLSTHAKGKAFSITRTGTGQSKEGEYHTYKITELVPKG